VQVTELIATARTQIRNLSPSEVAEALKDPGVVLLDVREPGEAETDGAIPGAIAAPRGMLEFHADPSSPYHLSALTPDRRVICYCKSGGRSALAAASLRAMGYADAAHLDGGIAAWNQAQAATAGDEAGPVSQASVTPGQ